MAINFPNNPQTGQVYNIGTKKWKWTGVSWTTVDVGDGTVITQQDTPPTAPSLGDLWFNTGEGILLIYYNDGSGPSQWVDLTGGTTITQAGNAIYTPGGVNAVDTTVEAKLRESISPLDYGAVGDGVADDTVALQNTLAAATDGLQSYATPFDGPAYTTVDLGGKKYRITDTIYIGRPVNFINGTIVATAAMTGPLNYMISVTGLHANLENLFLDGGDDGSVCFANLIWVATHNVTIKNVNGTHFPDAGIFTSNCNTCTIDNCRLEQWAYDEPGYTDENAWTAKCIHLFRDNPASGVGNNHNITNSEFAAALYPLYIEKSGTNTISNCSFWAGTDTSGSPSIKPDCVYIDGVSIGAGTNYFTTCDFINGAVRILGDNDFDFRQSFNGCGFKRYVLGTNDDYFIIESSATNTKCSGLVVTGCLFEEYGFSPNVITFQGTGTFVDDIDKEIQWVGNMYSDGRSVWYDAKFGAGTAGTGIWTSTHTTVNSSSGTWDSTYTTVSANSATWSSGSGYDDTILQAASGDWNDAYTTVQAESGDWDSTYTTVSANSATWGSSGSISSASYSIAAGSVTSTGVLNITEDFDADGIGTVSNGTVTLGAGTYMISHYGEYREEDADSGDYYQVHTRHNSVNQTEFQINETDQSGASYQGYYARNATFLITSASTQTVDIYAVDNSGIGTDTLNHRNVKLTIIKLS